MRPEAGAGLGYRLKPSVGSHQTTRHSGQALKEIDNPVPIQEALLIQDGLPTGGSYVGEKKICFAAEIITAPNVPAVCFTLQQGGASQRWEVCLPSPLKNPNFRFRR